MAETGRPVVAIDGPSGVGKSSVAQRVAARLGLPVLDTGALYRALGLQVLESGVDPGDREAVLRTVEGADVRLRPAVGAYEVLLGGEPVEERIRRSEVGEATSRISAYPEVRRRLVELQRSAGGRGAVVEGRDIGTVVFPETRHKFFLEARPEVRVERRRAQLAARGSPAGREEVAAEIRRRDRRDRGRATAPLTCDDSYTVIDTSDLTLEEVADRIVREVRKSTAR